MKRSELVLKLLKLAQKINIKGFEHAEKEVRKHCASKLAELEWEFMFPLSIPDASKPLLAAFDKNKIKYKTKKEDGYLCIGVPKGQLTKAMELSDKL